MSFRGTTMGYYPASLFDSAGLGNSASRVAFGGEVINQWAGGAHTSTDMGSGAAPDLGWQHAAYVRNMMVRDSSYDYVDFDSSAYTFDDAPCYTVGEVVFGGTWGTYMYLGGEGMSTACP